MNENKDVTEYETAISIFEENKDIKDISDSYSVYNEDNLAHELNLFVAKDEYNLYCDLVKCHNKCINSEKGSKFGTIGGGLSVIYEIMNNIVIGKYFTCHGCHETSYLCSSNLDIIYSPEFEKKYELYLKYQTKMTYTEYIRYKKFCEDYMKDNTIIRFYTEQTGLGTIKILECPSEHVKADITDTENW